ncbi:S8 family peptidase [Shewanella loihica]
MERKPILTFYEPKKDLQRNKLPNPVGSELHGPGIAAQANKIFPKIEELTKKFSENIHLSDTPDGMLPEKVLVLEIAGNIQNLANALSKVPGFEVLSEYIIDSDFQDEEYYLLNKDKIKPSGKNAYLTMSNQAGLASLHAMWRKFKESGYIEVGFTPLREAFLQLNDIRFWETKDRLANTYLLEDWQYRLEDAAQGFGQNVSFEIELWYRTSGDLRAKAEGYIRRVISACGGEILGGFVHDGISYHGLIGRLPIEQVQAVVETAGAALELMRCDEVMFFRPLGQCAMPVNNDSLEESVKFEPLVFEQQQPIVALLDGLPQANHEALRERIWVDDPDDFESLYQSRSEHMHGTSMASIIIHGDLSQRGELSLDRPLYVRPILAPEHQQLNGTRVEQIPSTYLPLDLVHRAVKRIKEGENGSGPVAPEIVIINLSVGDPYRLFDTQMSPWARMIDWLSFKYGVLFVVSAGNMSQSLLLEGVTEHDFRLLSPDEIEAHAINAIAKQKFERRMMSPAEAINVLTVKSSHADCFDGNLPPNQIDVFCSEGMFSPINPITLGKKNSVKPEVLMPGGRQTYINKTLLAKDDVVLAVSQTNRFGPGVKSALPSSSPGDVSSYGFTSGTSNAAALASRRLAFLYETLQEIKELGDASALSFAPDSVILKALFVHGAEHLEQTKEVITKHLKNKSNSRIFKSELNQYLGFGVVNENRIHGCQSNQATLIYTGVVRDGEAHEYELPLPPSLAANTANRRLIVTVAWMAPVNHGHQDYRGAQLWATPASKLINANDPDYYFHHLKNGTVFHEVRLGAKAASFTKGDKLAIQLHCNARAGFDGLEVPYALVVTLDTPGTDLPIYEEVKNELELTVSSKQSQNA